MSRSVCRCRRVVACVRSVRPKAFTGSVPAKATFSYQESKSAGHIVAGDNRGCVSAASTCVRATVGRMRVERWSWMPTTGYHFYLAIRQVV